MKLSKAPKAPEPKIFVNIQDYVGSDIAIRHKSTQTVNTEYGDQRVYIVDVLPLDGELETDLYCFWRDIQRQLDEAKGWIAGRLVKENLGRTDRHIIDASLVSEDNFKKLSAAIDALDEIPF